VIEVFQDREPLLDDLMGFPALDMGDKTHAARIAFMARVIESLGTGRVVQALPLESKQAAAAPVGRKLQKARRNQSNIQSQAADCKTLKNRGNSGT